MPKLKSKPRPSNRELKAAIAETIRENPELMREVIAEALEDIALAEAIREGRKTKMTTWTEVRKVLRSAS